MGKQSPELPTLSICQIKEAIAAGRLLMRRARSEELAAKVILGLELPRFPLVVAQCVRGEPKLLRVASEYLSMVAVAAVILGRSVQARELAGIAAGLPMPNGDTYFSSRRKEIF